MGVKLLDVHPQDATHCDKIMQTGLTCLQPVDLQLLWLNADEPGHRAPGAIAGPGLRKARAGRKTI